MAKEKKEALVDNAADESQVKNAERLEKLAENQQREDIKWLMSSPSGRRIVWNILERCEVNGSIFTNDPYILSYRSGQQDIGHWLLGIVGTHDNEGLFTMMKEHK